MNKQKTYLNEQWDLLRPIPNAPREKGVIAAAVLQPDEIEQLDRIAQALGMSRSEYLRASFIANRDDAIAAGVLTENVTTPA